MMDYAEFLDRKAQLGGDHGFEPVDLPSWLFDFQQSLTQWALRKGRAAVFADCGLGKTAIELVWADNIVKRTGGRVLLLTPLAVVHQIAKDAEKFGIEPARIDGSARLYRPSDFARISAALTHHIETVSQRDAVAA